MFDSILYYFIIFAISFGVCLIPGIILLLLQKHFMKGGEK